MELKFSTISDSAKGAFVIFKAKQQYAESVVEIRVAVDITGFDEHEQLEAIVARAHGQATKAVKGVL